MGLNSHLTPDGWEVDPLVSPYAKTYTDPASGQTVIVGPDGKLISLTKNPMGSSLKLLGGMASHTLGSDASGFNVYGQLPTTSIPIAVRVRIRNYHASNSMTMEGMKITPVDRHMSTQNWQSALTKWTDWITFKGQQTVSVPAASGGIPGMSDWSDWMPVDTFARTDTPGAPRLYRYAMHFPPGYPIALYGGGRIAAINADPLNPGFKYATQAGPAAIADLISTGLALGESGSMLGLADWEFMYADRRPQTLAAFGDSTFEGDAVNCNGIALLGFDSLASGVPLEVSNFGLTDQTLQNSHAALRGVLDGKTFANFAYFSSLSPNNLLNATTLPGLRKITLDTITYLTSQGITPLIRTPVAFAALNGNPAAPAAILEDQDAWVRSLASTGLARVVDLRELSTTAWVLKPEYQRAGNDGVHLNRAAYLVEAAALKAAIGS